MLDKFAVFILSHGRPDKVTTHRTLRRKGYTGPIYVIIDNEDETAEAYRKKYGDEVIMFDKPAAALTFDAGDNFNDRRSVIYARNASFGIAEDLGLDYFLQLDDDYNEFYHKFTADLNYRERPATRLDDLFEIVLDFYKSIPALTIALGQTGDLIGGEYSTNVKRIWLKRKAMNAFFCATDRPFDFVGRLNDDVNTYITHGNRGELFFTFFNVVIAQRRTQETSGGLTEAYLDYGTYVKSFYSVMFQPSFVKISEMGHHRRIHHKIDWPTAVPCILSEHHQKSRRS